MGSPTQDLPLTSMDCSRGRVQEEWMVPAVWQPWAAELMALQFRGPVCEMETNCISLGDSSEGEKLEWLDSFA